MPYYPPAASAGGYSTFENAGTPVTQRTTANFTGAGVSTADSGGKTVVTIAGAAGASATTVEVNLGAAAWRGKFTITDAAILATSKVRVWQAPGPYTGKGTRADEAEMDYIMCTAAPAAGSATVYWRTLYGYTQGRDSGALTTRPITALPASMDRSLGPPVIVGKVKGNVKFTYTVA